MYDGDIGKDRFGHGHLPQGFLGIKGSKVPQVPTQRAAVEFGASRVRGELAGDFLCYQVVVIPELHRAWFVNTCQHRSRRWFPIGRQNWFSNDQDAQVGVLDSFQ